MTAARPASFPVLVVDDDRFMRTVLQVNLTEAGYDVTTAENGRDALAIMNSGNFPLVMTDLVMPEMDGLDLCRAIRQKASSGYTYIILLTAQATKEDVVKGLEAGADEYLVKPVNQAELTARLKTARRILDLEASLKKSLEEITTLSVRDSLTGIFNRRYLDERLPQELKRAFRYKHPLSIVMFDLDHFKAVNDTHGHHTGDIVLQESVGAIKSSIRREIDWLARYGGEEFVMVLPETDLAGATVVAERSRRFIAGLAIKSGEAVIHLTASFGIATYRPLPEQAVPYHASLLAAADRCLYQAKADGRDRVVGTEL